MGQSETKELKFPIQNYLKPGITTDEIIGLKNLFDSLDPEDNKIKVSKLKELYSQSYDKNQIDNQIGIKDHLDWDDFYNVMSLTIIEQKQKYQNIEIDSAQKEIHCVLCPTTVDKGQN